MRLLADENLPGGVVRALRDACRDVAWIRTSAPGINDDAVLSLARAEGRVLITFDKDFGDLVWNRGATAGAGVVLFRHVRGRPEAVVEFVVRTLGLRSDWEEHFSVVTPSEVRMRRLRP